MRPLYSWPQVLTARSQCTLCLFKGSVVSTQDKASKRASNDAVSHKAKVTHLTRRGVLRVLVVPCSAPEGRLGYVRLYAHRLTCEHRTA